MSTTELDIEQPDQLRAYLEQTGRITPGEPLEVRTLAGGVSNRTVLVRRSSGEAWVLKQALAKLRVAVDWFSDPARIQREALGIRWLSRLAPQGAVPSLVFEDPAHHLLAMAAVPQPHDNWKSLLLAGRLEEDHVAQFARLLGQVHRSAAESRESLASVFDDRRFFQTLRIEPYYEYTASQVPEAAPFLKRLIEQTLDRRLTLVHGDYSPKNILIHQGRLVLLDHEVIHWGDPAFDLGFSLAHLLSKAHHLHQHRDAFARAANHYWLIYRETLGDPPWASSLEGHAVAHALGCLLARVAGRSQLEYLGPQHKRRQRDAVTHLMSDPPDTVAGLTQGWMRELSSD